MLNRVKKYYLGVNYWGSKDAVYMWKNYDKVSVENDIKFLSESGVNIIRIFPLWPDFQPLNKIRLISNNSNKNTSFYMRTGDKPLPYQKYPNSGLDEKQVENMRHLLTVAKEQGIKVILSIITGWMSGRKFVPQPFIDRDLIKDPEVVLYECEFVKDLIYSVKDFENIIAYEPGNETNCLSTEANEFQAELWIKLIVDTIEKADPTRPVLAGMHCTRCSGEWNLLMQKKYFNMVTPHPYPAFTPYCENEKLTEMRASMHAAVESSYYQSMTGLPSMVQEIGVLSENFLCDELVPDYVEKSLITSYMVGSKAYLWWCAFDQKHLDFAPYDTNANEVGLGMASIDYKPKPALLKYGELRDFIDTVGELPLPDKNAVTVINRTCDNWTVAYGSFMLGVQSGNYIDFSYSDQILKDSEYYIVPCLDGGSSMTKYTWKALEEKVNCGAKVLITYGDGSIPEFERWTGLKVFGREKVNQTVNFEINGKKMSVNRNLNLELKENTAKILVKDQNGNIIVSKNRMGKGSVFFVNIPLEKFYTQSYYPEKTDLYEIYSLFFADRNKIVDINDKYVFKTLHKYNDGTIGVMIYNFNKSNLDLKLNLNEDYSIEKIICGKENKGKIEMNKKYAFIKLKKK